MFENCRRSEEWRIRRTFNWRNPSNRISCWKLPINCLSYNRIDPPPFPSRKNEIKISSSISWVLRFRRPQTLDEKSSAQFFADNSSLRESRWRWKFAKDKHIARNYIPYSGADGVSGGGGGGGGGVWFKVANIELKPLGHAATVVAVYLFILGNITELIAL